MTYTVSSGTLNLVYHTIQRRWLFAVPVSRQGFDHTTNTQNIITAVCVNWPHSYAAVHKQNVPVIRNPITKILMLYVGRPYVYITSALLKTFHSLKPVFYRQVAMAT